MTEPTCNQSFIGIWYHDNNLSPEKQDKMELLLNQIFYYPRIFVNDKEYFEYIIEEQLVVKIFLIISKTDSSLDSIVKLAEQQPNIFEKVYRFSCAQISTSTCASTNDMDDLFKLMNKDIQDYINRTNLVNHAAKNRTVREQQSIEPSFTNRLPPSFNVFKQKPKKYIPIRHLPKESLIFVCFLAMTEILHGIPSYKPEEISEMWDACRKNYENIPLQINYINTLEATYDVSKAIEYYTQHSCLSRTVNKAYHNDNVQEVVPCRVYISHLHRQLIEVDRRQEENGTKSTIGKLYRGKPLSGSVLQQLIDNVDGFISLNGFLSTTVDRDVALKFAGDTKQLSGGQKSVLFMLEIDTQVRQPYGFIGEYSTKREECEVLFSIGVIWRIKSIKHHEDLCTIELISYDGFDSQSTELLGKYTKNGCNFSSVGDISYDLGNYDAAKWFYEKMLEQDSLENNFRSYLYCKIGAIQLLKKNYSDALHYYNEAAAELVPSTTNDSDGTGSSQPLYVSDNQSPFVAIHNTMGIIYEKDGCFEEAISYYKKALKVKNGSRLEKAIVYNNLGLLYYNRKNYEEALKHHTKAVDNIDETHPNWVEFKRNVERAKTMKGSQRRTTFNELLHQIFRWCFNIFIILVLIVRVPFIFLIL